MKKRLTIVADSPLPPLYAGWMQALLDGPIPHETEATCDDCAMLPAAGDEPLAGAFFHSGVKCCTYVPSLPNFLAGRVLADSAAPGRAALEQRIAEREAITPLGVGITARSRALYKHIRDADSFGRDATVRCPHYVEGKCGIWRHRNSVCATWFCKHVRGLVSRRFWHTGLEPLLAAVERSLARHCLLALDLDAASILQTLPHVSSTTSTAAPFDVDWRALWGRWAGREGELYVTCAEQVERMTWDDVIAACDPEVTLRARAARALHEQLLARALPAKLRVGRFEIASAEREHVRVVTYSAFDPIDVPAALLPLLHCFDGRPTRAVRRSLARRGVEVDDDFLLQLVDFGILVDAEATAAPL